MHLENLDQLRKREALLKEPLGVCTSAGIAHLQLPDVGAITAVTDLVVCSLKQFEAIACEKGAIGCIEALLAEQWQQRYTATCPRGVCSHQEMRQAQAA